MILVLIVVLIWGMRISYLVGGKRFLSPWFLINLFLFVSTFFYAINFSFFAKDISLSTVVVITIGLMSWGFGEIASGIVVNYSNKTSYLSDTDKSPLFFPNTILLGSSVLIGIVTIYHYEYFMAIGRSMGGSTILGNYALARVYLVDASNISGVEVVHKSSMLTIMNLFASALAYYFLFYYFFNRIICSYRGTKRYLVPIILYSPAFFFSTGRMAFASFLSAVIGMVGILVYRKYGVSVNYSLNKKFVKYGIFILLFAIAIFRFSGEIRGGKYLDKSDTDDYYPIINELCTYVSSPIYGLSYYLEYDYRIDNVINSEPFAKNTWGGIYVLLRKFGLNIKDTPKHQKTFTWENGSSNVYTGFKTDIEDYSIIGMIPYLLIIGFICGVFYRRALIAGNLKNSAVFYVVLSKLYYPICFYFFVDDFYTFTTIDFFIELISLLLINRFFVGKLKARTIK